MMNEAYLENAVPESPDRNRHDARVRELPLNVATLPLNVSAMIGASAGTGKTYTITYLVLRLLLGSGGKNGFGRPLSLDELLVVTFTKAAASDLKERIREKIRQARKAFESVYGDLEPAENPDPALKALLDEMTAGDDPKGRALECARLLLRAERGIDDAAISTIHSFANVSLNRIYSFEAGSAFEVELTEEQGLEPLRKRAHLEIWRELFYHDDASSRALLKLLKVADPAGLSQYESLLSKVRLPYRSAGVKTVLGFAVKGEEFERFSSYTSPNGLKKALFAYALEMQTAEQKLIDEFTAKWERYKRIFVPFANFAEFKAGHSEKFVKLKPNKGDGFFALLEGIFAAPDAPEFEALSALIKKKCTAYKEFCELTGRKFVNAKTELGGDEASLIEEMLMACHCVYLYGMRIKELRIAGKLVASTLTSILISNRFDALCAAQDKLSMDGLLLSLDRALHDVRRGDMLAEVLRERYPVAMIDEFQDTDPVQFSIFRKLYLKKGTGRSACFLIGDPKQSIYRFRNADIRSYILARTELSLAAGGEGGVYTLDTNYRSSRGVVEGVNCIFKGFPAHAVNDDPFADAGQNERIDYSEVKTGGGKLHFFWDDDPRHEVGNMVYFDARPPLDKNKKQSHSVKCDAMMAEVAAQAVLRCLTHGMLVDKAGNSRRVVSSDIAILVSKGKEYELLAPILKSYGIPCVYYSDKSSVLKTADVDGFGKDLPLPSEAARSMLALMEAMNGYFSQGKVLKLMGTPLSCLEGESFCKLTVEGDAFERETEILRECASCWSEYGFLSAFTLWMKRRGVMKKLLAFKGGERRLTDYLQIAEILQSRHGVLYGAEAQIRYLRDLIEHDGRGVAPDEVRKRLESERSQVKIYTIHKSKGLEFPIVILPFLWGKGQGNKAGGDASVPKVTYSVQAHRRVLVARDPDGTVVASECREQREEQMRLLYVALTRACAANFLCISKEMLNDSKKALCAELSLCLGNLPMKQADFDKLKELFAAAEGNFVCKDYVGDETERLMLEYRQLRTHEESHADLQASELERGSIRRNFTVSSYSAVTSGLHDAATLEQSDATGDRKESSSPRTVSVPDGFTFPAGTEPGTFLHALLQDCDFSRLDDLKFDLKKMLVEEVRRMQGEHLVDEWYRRTAREGRTAIEIPAALDEAVSPLCAWFYEITHAVLPGLDAFSLSSLKSGDWIPEMDYLVPTAQVSVERINALCVDSADEVFPDHGTLKLNAKKLCGFITGSLDLVFRAPMGGRLRYFVADYKSTLLGRCYEDYSPQAVAASVFDPKNRYDVQYLFYSLALHRFLKSRIRDYSYARDFGGVFYLYLRGMRRGDDGSGIFYTKPSLKILEALERMFDGNDDDGRSR